MNFYPRPPRGGRPVSPAAVDENHLISIHALREEGDCFVLCYYCVTKCISIHALREEGD